MRYSHLWKRSMFVETGDSSFYRQNTVWPSAPSHCPTNKTSRCTLQSRRCVWWEESEIIFYNDTFRLRRNDCVLNTLWLQTVGWTGSSVDWRVSWGHKQPQALRCRPLGAAQGDRLRWQLCETRDYRMHSWPVGIGEATTCSAVWGYWIWTVKTEIQCALLKTFEHPPSAVPVLTPH